MSSSISSSVSTVTKVFNELSYEPVLDSEANIKSWISTQNNGTFTAFIQNAYQLGEKKEKVTYAVKNPSTGAVLAQVVNSDKRTVDQAIDACKTAAKSWKSLSHTERGRIIYNIARNIQKHLTLLTGCESLFSGRSSREVKDLDIANIIKTFYYYAGAVGLHSTDSDFDSHLPIGVVAIAGHYDSPLLSIVNKLASALATGNTCLLIPHKYTPISAYMLLNICVQSDVPAGVINLVVSDNDDIYKLVSSNNSVNVFCYDGKSQIAQDLIISNSFFNPNKRNLFSLEGKSSLVIYETADVDSAIEAVVDGCFYANGQHRYSLNKVLVQEPVLSEVLAKLNSRFEKIRFGNHMDKCNDYGPFINADELKSFKEALGTQATEYGATLNAFDKHTASAAPAHGPVIISNVGLNLPLNLNETNGPYVILIPFRTVKESVELINTTKYGSSVSLFSQNISLVMEVAYLLNVGTVWINSLSIERGVQTRKMSGNYKLSGLESLKNFLRPIWDRPIELAAADEAEINLDQVLKQVKAFGSANSEITLPQSEQLSEEKTYKLYIGGKQTRPDTQSSRTVYHLNKENKKAVHCLVADASRKDVRNAVEAAVAAFNPWWKRANHNKSQILYYFGENFDSRAAMLVDKLELLTKKTRTQCEAEVKACSNFIFHMASVCDKQVGRLNDTTEYGFMCELNEPLGCIGIVCGHNANTNYPLLFFIVHLIGAIAYGNTVVIVPDETTPLPALDLYEIFDTSDMPGGVVNILTGSKHHLTKYLCEHQQVNAIWYMNDTASSNDQSELLAQQFIRYTCQYNLKQSWLISSAMPIDEKFLCKNYASELYSHAVQSKYIQVPMGTIFAN